MTQSSPSEQYLDKFAAVFPYLTASELGISADQQNALMRVAIMRNAPMTEAELYAIAKTEPPPPPTVGIT